jgi:hypothetical protein
VVDTGTIYAYLRCDPRGLAAHEVSVDSVFEIRYNKSHRLRSGRCIYSELCDGFHLLSPNYWADIYHG